VKQLTTFFSRGSCNGGVAVVIVVFFLVAPELERFGGIVALL